MIGTAIRNQPFGRLACAGRLLVRDGRVGAPAQVVRGCRKRPPPPSRLLDARKLLAAVLVFAVIFGSVVCGPAAHPRLEGDASAGIQLVGAVAKAPGEHGAPAKGNLSGWCTGHCAAHAFNLPVQFVQSFVPFVNRAVWLVVDDQWSRASRSARLERPPRV